MQVEQVWRRRPPMHTAHAMCANAGEGRRRLQSTAQGRNVTYLQASGGGPTQETCRVLLNNLAVLPPEPTIEGLADVGGYVAESV